MTSLTARRTILGTVAAIAYLLLVAIPTDLVPNPFFTREIPPEWWAWPALVASSVLAGLLAATYVRPPEELGEERTTVGAAGGVLTFFALGCPVCNKLVLLVLGWQGAITWFQPVQPWLQLVALALLGVATVARWRTLRSCPLSPAPTRPPEPDP